MFRKDNLFSKEEIVRLVEERGVAASPWKKEIDAIASYIRGYVKDEISETSKEIIEFDVPKNICNIFSFLDDISIHVIAKRFDEGSRYGSGSLSPKGTLDFSISLNQFLNPGKVIYGDRTKRLHHCEITINCLYNDAGKVWLNGVLGNLYHEINHAYEQWMDASKTKSYKRFNRTSLKATAGLEISKRFPAVGECIYRLFSETEYNALVASVFGDLEEIDSNFENFRNDYKDTQAYSVYNYLKTNLESEVRDLSVDECEYVFGKMENVGISLNMVKNTVSSFKNSFLHKANIKLNNLMHDIGRTASFYYDKKHEKDIDNGGQPYKIF